MAFKIGDIVMRLDGDGRPHKIVIKLAGFAACIFKYAHSNSEKDK